MNMLTTYLSGMLVILCCGYTLSQDQADVRVPPTVDTPLLARTDYFSTGSNFTLSCNATGTPQPKYTWHKDGTNFTSDYISVNPITGSLLVKSATIREEGRYRCLATNTWGTAVSQEVEMLLVRGNRFDDIGFRPMTKVAGESASMRCENPPDSVPLGSFAWYLVDSKDKQRSFNPAKRYGVDETGTLHFAYLEEDDRKDGKLYACGLHNPKTDNIYLGSKVDLTVTPGSGTSDSKPRILYMSGVKKGFIGKSVILECFFGGKPVPDIQWYDKYNNAIFPNNTHFNIEDHGRRVKIPRVTDYDEGTYTCEASNSQGRLKETTFLNVTSRPMWVEPPLSQTVVEGSNVTFTCISKGADTENTPSPPIWYQNGEQLPQNDKRIIDFTKFRLLDVSRDTDIMNVQCLVQNEFGSIFQDAYLNILSPITIQARPSPVIRVVPGDVKTLSVSAVTDPSRTLVFRWTLNSEDIRHSQPGITLRSNDTNSVITINTTNVGPENLDTVLGLYACIVSHDVQYVVVSSDVRRMPSTTEPTTTEAQPVTEGIREAASTGMWWVLAVVLGLLLVVGSVVLIVLVLRHRYPKRVYLLEKKELKNKLDPQRDLENDYFQTL
ncbi:neural cell adhesion molecule L1-like [Haliotis asinina]|uniref:neural cell adhesion molecule L1-like n=1 Tax=Haliotis asinina TaxID=109174 RepID=UPI003531A858